MRSILPDFINMDLKFYASEGNKIIFRRSIDSIPKDLSEIRFGLTNVQEKERIFSISLEDIKTNCNYAD